MSNQRKTGKIFIQNVGLEFQPFYLLTMDLWARFLYPFSYSFRRDKDGLLIVTFCGGKEILFVSLTRKIIGILLILEQ